MPRPSRPLDNLDQAIKLYEGSDRSFSDIANELNVPRRLLREQLRERGTLRDPRTAQALSRARAEQTRLRTRGLPEPQICEAYLAGTSEQALALKYGVSRGAITTILERGKIPRRSITDANRLMMAGRSAEENLRNTQAAHDAVRGSHVSLELLCAKAAKRHGSKTGHALELLYDAWLRLRGIECVPQYAVGPYNCDLGAAPVAVEVFGGHWHGHGRHAEVFTERSQYILDQGWNLVFVWVNQSRQRLSETSADYVASFIEESRRDPSLRGEYRVVWGDGQVVPTAGRKLHEFALVPAHASRAKAG